MPTRARFYPTIDARYFRGVFLSLRLRRNVLRLSNPTKREPSPKSGSGKAWKNSNNAIASSIAEADVFDEVATDKSVKSSNKEQEEEECISLNVLWETPIDANSSLQHSSDPFRCFSA